VLRAGPKLTVAMAAVVASLAFSSSAFAQSTKPLPSLTRGPADGLSRALAQGDVTPAQYALQRALSLFHRQRVAARFGFVARPDARAATLILRDLALRARFLSGADRALARSLLARPTDGGGDLQGNGYTTAEATPLCGPRVCIHYVTSTASAVAPTDTNPNNGIPDYVDSALAVFDTQVWGQEVDTFGYRAPKSDATSSNNGSSSADLTGAKFDVYLAEIGSKGLYGYCTTDDPHFVPDWDGSYQFFDASAYCVVDNDYAGFPLTPIENLEVTAAHEFFHAVQFAYDWLEDQWFMESTATWMEDEVYDDIDDNLQYLPDGPLAKPGISLDRGATDTNPCCHVYGDWIFFRFLSEFLGPGVNVDDPSIVKSIWQRADGSAVGPDDFSVQAVANALAGRGKNFRQIFAKFGWTNRISRRVYDEGQPNLYPQAPLTAAAMTLSRSAPSRSKAPKLKHQTSVYFEFRRGAGVSSTAKLKLMFDLPTRSTGAAASALVFKKSGAIVVYEFAISIAGDGTFKVPFGSGVAKVNVILTNASTRYMCWQGTIFGCQGKPLDDGRTYKLVARLA
jgi:hypothetical protein